MGQRDPRSSSLCRHYYPGLAPYVTRCTIAVDGKLNELQSVYERVAYGAFVVGDVLIEEGETYFLVRFPVRVRPTNRFYIVKFDGGQWVCSCPQEASVPGYIRQVEEYIQQVQGVAR